MNIFLRVVPALALVQLVACGGGGGSSEPVLGPEPVVRVDVSPSAPQMVRGTTLQLSASAYDRNSKPISGRTVSWRSHDTSIATVSPAGFVTAVAAGGPVRITATISGTEGHANISVTEVQTAPPAVDRVSVSPGSGVIEEGSTSRFTATAYDAEGEPVLGRGVSWTIENNSIATVAPDGTVTALRPGSTSVRARIDGRSAAAGIRIEAHYPFELMFGAPGSSSPGAYSLDIRDPAAIARLLPANGQPRQAVASPDGRRVAYSMQFTWTTAIFVANRDGSGAVALIEDNHLNDQPAWSPDGSQIAFRRRTPTGAADIWIMSAADGSGARNLTELHGATNQASPAFSPVLGDQSVWIAYSHAEQGAAHIWAMRSDGTGHRRVTTAADVYDDEPSWSPDGTTIVFQRNATGIFGDLYRVPAAGGNGGLLMQLAGPLAGGQFSPSWSPDGRLVAFASRHSGDHYQIYTVWHDGTRLAQRTFAEQDHDYPRWAMLAD